ncbi:FAD-binding protein [Mucilaginibacter sp. PAMB04274]|uniref:FAD-binding protein n=1 Tax=Mucilaginibacter sp. PAMB04274 TaxID=3138568 RepID=UPI0031F604CB
MKKRSFLKMSSALLAGVAFTPFYSCFTPPKKRLKNWAENIEFSTDNLYYPESISEIQEIVKRCKKIRVFGSRHSFNRIADSDANMISLSALNKVIDINEKEHTVTVQGGIRYSELAPYLYKKGYALPNLASLPHITIEGAVATATHGSGVSLGNLATSVSAIEFVDATGALVHLTRKDHASEFAGAVVSLGALGIVTKITLDLVPTFDMTQVVYLNMPMKTLKNNMLAVLSASYSVSLFTNWANQNVSEVWLIDKAINGATAEIKSEFYGAKAARNNVHPVIDQSAEKVTDQMGVPGPWFERMPHFKMGFKPSTGKELQSEFFVGIEHAYDAMMAIEQLHKQITPHLFITEIRTIKGDDLWMSPCYQQDCVAFHFTWKQENEAVNSVVNQIEEKLAAYRVRPHWAKIFTLKPEVLQLRYERLHDFKSLMKRYDPQGKFRNDFIDRNLLGS